MWKFPVLRYVISVILGWMLTIPLSVVWSYCDAPGHIGCVAVSLLQILCGDPEHRLQNFSCPDVMVRVMILARQCGPMVQWVVGRIQMVNQCVPCRVSPSHRGTSKSQNCFTAIICASRESPVLCLVSGSVRCKVGSTVVHRGPVLASKITLFQSIIVS